MDLQSGANWNGTGGWMLRAPVAQNRPEASGVGGGIGGFLRGNWQQLAGTASGFLTQFLPGMSGTGSNIGASVGGALGGFKGIASALGGFAPFLGPLAGIAGGLIGKLFGQSEHSKVNDQRDQCVGAQGGIHELNKRAQEAGLTLDRLLNAKKVKDFEAAVRELNDAFADQAADQQRLTAAMESPVRETKEVRWGRNRAESASQNKRLTMLNICLILMAWNWSGS